MTKIIEGAKEAQPDGWRYRYKGGKWLVQKNKPHWYKPGQTDVELDPLFVGHSSAEVESMREALRRLINTYRDMQDGDGNPCPDVAFAREVLGGDHAG